MIAPVLVLMASTIPSGAYGMPELCEKLTAATGTAYSVDPELKDYPVYLSTKSGDPERVKQIVADALRGKWVKDGERVKLIPTKAKPDEGFDEFERQFRAAAKGPIQSQLPAHDLFEMASGSMIRYGYPETPIFKALPKKLEQMARESESKSGHIWVHRMAEGIFEFKASLGSNEFAVFDPNSELDFGTLPPKVEQFLSGYLDKIAMDPAHQQEIRPLISDPRKLIKDWSDPEKHDPLATVCGLVLSGFGAAVQHDVAIALPDMAMMTIQPAVTGRPTVRALMQSLSSALDWELEDEALIGKTPSCDRISRSQVKRNALSAMLKAVGRDGMANVSELSGYVSSQRPAASDSWIDAAYLVLAGAIVDQDYLGDYPYNLRLYVSFSQGDWNLIRSGNPFAASELSAQAKQALIKVLLDSRTRLERDQPDPSLWTESIGSLVVSAELKHDEVLMASAGVDSRVQTVEEAAHNYERELRSMGHEPLYQPATREKLVLTISSPADRQEVKTGFSNVKPSSSKPCKWGDLPAGTAAEFKKALEEFRRGPQPPNEGVPPP